MKSIAKLLAIFLGSWLFLELKIIVSGSIYILSYDFGGSQSNYQTLRFWIDDNSLFEIYTFVLLLPVFIIFYLIVLTIFKKILKLGDNIVEKIIKTSFALQFIAVIFALIIQHEFTLLPSIALAQVLASPYDFIVSVQYQVWFAYSLIAFFVLADLVGLFAAKKVLNFFRR